MRPILLGWSFYIKFNGAYLSIYLKWLKSRFKEKDSKMLWGVIGFQVISNLEFLEAPIFSLFPTENCKTTISSMMFLLLLTMLNK